MLHSRRLLLAGSLAGALAVAGVAVAVPLIHSSAGTPGGYTGGAVNGGYGTMMGGGYGTMMGGGGYGPAPTPGSETSNPPAGAAPHGSQAVTLRVKSDTEHGKLGPDGSWHDAFLPAGFTVRAGESVTVTVYNYDDMPHSFTSQALGVNQTILGGSASAPSKTTFTFTAPSQPGNYLWWCALPCDPYSMSTIGFMRGYVTVST